MYKIPTKFFSVLLCGLLLLQPIFAVHFNAFLSTELTKTGKKTKKTVRPVDRKKIKPSSPVAGKSSDSKVPSKKAGQKNTPRLFADALEGQSATRLPDGNWLLLGGKKGGKILDSAIIRQEEANESPATLPATMTSARAGHTATLLPNGNVLILGGKGANDKIVAEAEIFDFQTQQFARVEINRLTARANHSATLLTDGWILLTGGLDDQYRVIGQVERINSRNLETQTIRAKMQQSRHSHSAELQADGTVLFEKGFDENGIEVNVSESFDPKTGNFVFAGTKPPDDANQVPYISFSEPGNGDSNVSVDTLPVLRFSKLLKVKSVNAETVQLTGTAGEVSAKIIAAENGRLLFIAPETPLKVNTTYNLRLRGLVDKNDLALPETILIFRTEEFCEVPPPATVPPVLNPTIRTAPQIIDEDSWFPGDDRFKNDKVPKEQKTPFLQASPAVTGLSGQVQSLSGKPLANVTMTVQGQNAVTDNQGRFLLTGLKAGQSGMVINGETASLPGKTFGAFEALVDIDEGKTNILPYTIYLPTIDKQNEVRLETPTRLKTVVTTSRVPKLEVHIAADAVLKMPRGHGMSHNLTDLTPAQQMTTLGITPIPVERPPFPLPNGTKGGLLFTLQMHGAKVEGPNGEKRPGLRFVFPNYDDLPAGTRMALWNYDSTKTGWVMYGEATVSPDRTKIIPDSGVELEGMQCLTYITLGGAPATGPNTGTHGMDGDPVDLATGLFVYEQTDLVIPDTIPINLSRTYRQGDGAVRAFGVGVTQTYSMNIVTGSPDYTELVVQGGANYRFEKDPNNQTVFRHTATPTAFYKAEMRFLSYPQETDYYEGSYEIKMRDGTRLIFARMNAKGGQPLGIQYVNIVPHKFIDRFGNTLTFTRDPNTNTMTRITTPNGKWLEFNYYPSGQVSFVRDNIGRTVSYTYDEQKRLTKVVNAEGGETEYTYDNAHQMLTLKDARGIVNLTNEYDAFNRVKKQTAADGTIYQFAYTTVTEPNGTKRIVQTDVTNPRGLVRQMNFNEKGFPVSEIFGVGRADAWSYTYERDQASNWLISSTDSWSRKTLFTYDEFGNILSTKFLEGTTDEVTTSASYTTFDNISSVTDALNRTSNFTYDSKGLLVSAKDWLNRQSTFTYTNKGQILTATDNLNRTSRFTYDRGSLVGSEDPLGRKTRQFVDGAGRVTRIYDPMGGIKKFRYNKHNRPVHGTDAMGRTAALLHDSVGNILEITDSRGGKIKYTYDAMSRPLTRTNQSNQVETYQYDAYGNLWKMTDHKNQVTEFTYDVFNRPTLVKYGDNSTTGYAYDGKGRVSGITDSAGGTITYGYDARDNVASETTDGGTVTYSYDAGGRIISMQALNQPLVSYAYDTADRIQSITQDNQTVAFTYDNADRRLTMTLPNGITAFYTYDTASQLKTMSYKRGATVLGEVSFEYDGNGRRTHVSGSLAQSLSPTAFTNATYDASNQQTAVNSQSLTFDQNGNLMSDGTNTYTWNAREELVAVSGPSLSASFQYDGEGRRISKTINGITTTYVYNGLQVVAEQQQQAGPVTTQLAGGLDEVFFRKTTSSGNSTTEFLLTDALGSTWGLADSSGNVNTQYQYDVFGQTQATGQASATNNPLQFTGRENDDTGLYYYRNRYYSPSLRRFISRDPLGEDAGENEYAYVSNNPISLTDPLGLESEGGYTASDIVKELSGFNDIAESVHTLGNRCASWSEKLWAGANLAMELPIPFLKVFKLAKMAHKMWKRVPCGPVTKWLGKCFVAGTLIHAKDGLKPIEEIKAGDEVLSYNEQTKQTEYQRVVRTFERFAEDVLSVKVEGETKPLGVTSEHPFFVRVYGARSDISTEDDGEWREANQLKIGDEIRTASGDWAKVESIESREEARVYNFEVENNHNYFVSELGLLAHNTCAANKLPRMSGKSVKNNEKILRDNGFTNTHTTSTGNQTWKHSDGSEVRVHPYGNQNLSNYKTANNAHLHKQDNLGNQLNDRGFPSTNPNNTHIGIPNPSDLPTVRGRPHGSGIY